MSILHFRDPYDGSRWSWRDIRAVARSFQKAKKNNDYFQLGCDATTLDYAMFRSLRSAHDADRVRAFKDRLWAEALSHSPMTRKER